MENNKPMFIDDYPVVALFRQFPELKIEEFLHQLGKKLQEVKL